MQAIQTDFQPMNKITTPLVGEPSYINSGIIKAVMKNGDKISVAQMRKTFNMSSVPIGTL